MAHASSHPPSNIFVVRHGARLDAADKDWTQSSGTPYDTPLTYGGWIQSRNLGVRIATLLQQSAPKDGKQRRVVIHTSPFLRCIQTSTSIASGIAQYHHQQITDSHWVTDKNGELQFKQPDSDPERFVKPLMRIDAWLGEWMTMDYYTDITPPPVSTILVNSAKNEYMRAPVPIPNSVNGSPRLPPIEQRSLPTSLTGGFIPPSPSYAASTSGQIPRGYYSQAKSYVDLDYAWNSTRLGDGADLGEEWSAMHKRFREGYKRLMQYYTSTTPSVATSPTASVNFQLTKRRQSAEAKKAPPSTCGNPTPPLSDSDSEDDDIETVLILVTHGAGCNSLIGALTDKPVLIDIGINSLTWGALHSPLAKDSNNLPAYDLKLTANTEHMRPATPRNATPPISPFLKARPPRNTTGLGNFVLTGSGFNASSLATAMGGVKSNRSASSGSSARPTGLWSMPRPEEREQKEPEKPWFEAPSPFVESIVSLKESEKEEIKVPVERSGCHLDGAEPEVPKPRGLWVARVMDTPVKRRWTVGREAFNGSFE